MLGKIRPVGNPVPLPESGDSNLSFPWDGQYVTQFMASGTEALSLAIALAVASRGQVEHPEVILPAYGCPDLVAAALAQGVKPTLVDLAKDSFYLNEKKVREALTPNCVAVVAVGLLGNPERLHLLSVLCRERGIFLIEDSAQCFPPSGSVSGLADAIVLSFGRGKPINLMGGGALIYRRDLDPEARKVVEQVPEIKRSIGIAWQIKRLIFNLMMARFLYWVVEKLPFLHVGETRFQECREVRRLALPAGLISAGIRTIGERESMENVFLEELNFLNWAGWQILGYYPCSATRDARHHPKIRLGLLAPNSEARNTAQIALNRHGIGATNLYGGILPEIDGLEGVFDQQAFPIAKDFSSRLLTLPSHEDVRHEDIRYIATILRHLVDDPRRVNCTS